MGQALHIKRSTVHSTAWLLLLLSLLWPQQALASQVSPLSRWLSRDTGPELEELLSQHPRYVGQRILVLPGDNALEQAVVTLLRARLARQDSIALLDPVGQADDLPLNGSIDAVDCQVGSRGDYLLRVEARSSSDGRDSLRLDLLDSGSTQNSGRHWQWSGNFSSAERRSVQKSSGVRLADGSLDAPWSEQEVDAAARALSWQLACALRPQLASRLTLQWPAKTKLPALFSDTANASRHVLGAYREIGLASAQASYEIEARVERFRHDTWQLWLIGTPAQPGLSPVQAVTYFRQAGLQWPQSPGLAERAPAKYTSRPATEEKALEFIEVQLLDATQADYSGSRAELQVTLRIANSAAWPIAYSFTLSGGHFNHCIANPAYYRHDSYGQLTGSLAAGASEVRRLTIDNARHRPTPLFGVRKCAGFRDLDGFETFASQGHKVTDFVRWDM